MTQPTLPPSPRAHDLPPKWDGFEVDWHGWEREIPIVCAPFPRPEPCPICGTLQPRVVNRGSVWAQPTRVPAIARGRQSRRHLVTNIYAYRCINGHDQVLDGLGADARLWDLDDDDYGDDGSRV